MKIALLSPSIYMSPTHFADMIFAPRDLSIDLANGLVARGHDVTFFTAPDVPTQAKLVPGDERLMRDDYVGSMLAGRESQRLEWGFRSVLKHNFEMDLTARCYASAHKEGFDVIHSYHERLAHFFDGPPIPTVYTLHDPLPSSALDLKYWLLEKFSDHKYVSISNAFRRHKTLHLNFIDTVYHGIKSSDIVPTFTSGKHIAFMGRLIKEKGIGDAIAVAKNLTIPLVIATSQKKENLSDDQYFHREVEPFLDESTVKVVGFMNKKERNAFLANALCFLFPIHWEEPFGMVMIEAMACGTPVIAYNRGSVSEIVRDGITGFIVDPDDEDRPGKGSWVIKKKGVEGLAEAVQRISEIDRTACRKHVEDHFTVEKMVQGYESVYQKILGKVA